MKKLQIKIVDGEFRRLVQKEMTNLSTLDLSTLDLSIL